jgi:hypothetical protein
MSANKYPKRANAGARIMPAATAITNKGTSRARDLLRRRGR